MPSDECMRVCRGLDTDGIVYMSEAPSVASFSSVVTRNLKWSYSRFNNTVRKN